MHLVILAAGQGTRLRPMTDSKPKCLVELNGKSILSMQLSTARQAGIKDLAVIRGYLKDRITEENVEYFENEKYKTTNMVETLWCAEKVFNDEFIMSYGDIIYETSVLNKLMKSENDISVVIDSGWQEYWEERLDDVLSDAETLKLENGLITKIGQKPKSIDEIQGQYIGLVAFKGNGINILRQVYNDAKKQAADGKYPLRGQRPFEKMYMTDLLQGIIDAGFPLTPVVINRKWLEIDSVSDLKYAESVVTIENNNLKITK